MADQSRLAASRVKADALALTLVFDSRALFAFSAPARGDGAHRGVRASSSPTGEPPSLAPMGQETVRRNADGLSANSGGSGSGGEGGGSGGDKEVRRCRHASRAQLFSFRATRARARDRLGGTDACFLALTTPRRPTSCHPPPDAGLRRVRV